MSHTETEPPTVEDDPTPPSAGDARTEFTDGSGAVVPEFAHTGNSPAAHTATREYECLDCGRRCETFLDDCPNCGETAFSTAVETTDTTDITDASVGVLAVLVARFHPLVPR